MLVFIQNGHIDTHFFRNIANFIKITLTHCWEQQKQGRAAPFFILKLFFSLNIMWRAPRRTHWMFYIVICDIKKWILLFFFQINAKKLPIAPLFVIFRKIFSFFRKKISITFEWAYFSSGPGAAAPTFIQAYKIKNIYLKYM